MVSSRSLSACVHVESLFHPKQRRRQERHLTFLNEEDLLRHVYDSERKTGGQRKKTSYRDADNR